MNSCGCQSCLVIRHRLTQTEAQPFERTPNAYSISPPFVHESTHQVNDVEARKQHITKTRRFGVDG